MTNSGLDHPEQFNHSLPPLLYLMYTDVTLHFISICVLRVSIKPFSFLLCLKYVIHAYGTKIQNVRSMDYLIVFAAVLIMKCGSGSQPEVPKLLPLFRKNNTSYFCP